jgi:glycosyltransferase involved in cell wall biosynthesis
VGRLAPEKGGAGLVTALAECRAAGLDAELHVVGDGPTRPAIETAIAARGIGAHCHLHGARSEAQALQHIADADVLVVASLMENLPVVLMEAMGIGTPVVAPRLAGIPELVEHERTGLLYEPGDWDGLARAVRRLADDPDLAARLAVEARRTVERDFDVARAVAPLVGRFLG